MLKKIIAGSTQKELNLKNIYYVIAREPGLTRTEIAERTDLKLSTCGRLMEELLANHLIYESGEAASSGGRRAKRYAVRSEQYYMIGIDISRTNVKVLLLNVDLSIVQEEKIKMSRSSTPKATLEKITTYIKKMIQRENIVTDNLLGIGVSAIGPLDIEKGMIKNPMHFPAPGWEDVPVVSTLEQSFSIPVVLTYGEHSALFAEHRIGAVRGCANALHINKGIGTRIGFLMNGKVIEPSNEQSAFGQGHMIVELGGKRCVCGSYGCLQAYTTIPAILNEMKHRLKKGEDSLLQTELKEIDELEFTHVIDALKRDDCLTKRVIQEAALYAATGICNLINLFQPEKIILNGPIYRELPLYYETVMIKTEERYRKLFPHLHITFSQGDLGENAIAIGAGGLLFEKLFAN